MPDASIPALDPDTARAKYGPWALVAGGSNGTGEGFARELAAVGINVVLVARKQETLDALAAELKSSYGVETRTLVQDLMEPDAARNMLAATADIDVGLYVSNAGADDIGAPFLEDPVERWQRLAQMNVMTVIAAVHGFGNRLRQRGRGGIVVMSSGIALGGCPNLAMYSATKGFEMLFTESLWAELLDTDIEVIGVLAPSMDTPLFHRIIGSELRSQMETSSTIFDPREIARDALSQLGQRPLLIYGSRRETPPDEVREQRLQALLASVDVGKAFAAERHNPELMALRG
ncbi:MAG TPA: SDR family NAD(P)-dependent oxidoreductase [Novosphingobium sp.]|nr:SDR family NAD(P)-dependent oxidoreductase [Novosphingobium sp.]